MEFEAIAYAFQK